jgi:hypothetical protein
MFYTVSAAYCDHGYVIIRLMLSVLQRTDHSIQTDPNEKICLL